MIASEKLPVVQFHSREAEHICVHFSEDELTSQNVWSWMNVSVE